MKHKDSQSPYESLEKQLLSLFFSGIYISSHDIRQLGEKIGIELPVKDRNILLSKLFGDANKNQKSKELLVVISDFIKSRAMQYTILGNNYPHTKPLVSKWLQKAKSTDLLIQREMKNYE
ncbi:MAG: hypothetical protein PHI79_03815 [Sulfurovaceae bacterium]|nr:hypothetical protein [Sulfurovaceae bacterium]MDD5548709.1 hypothetical protein [Sulfurovaceae bacterium]